MAVNIADSGHDTSNQIEELLHQMPSFPSYNVGSG